MPPTEDPCVGQTEWTVGAYLATCDRGDDVAVRCTAQGILQMRIIQVNAVRVQFGRLYTSKTIGPYGGAWWIKTGRTPDAPYGQTQLVEPTPAVRRFAADFPRGLKRKDRSFDLIHIKRIDGQVLDAPDSWMQGASRAAQKREPVPQDANSSSGADRLGEHGSASVPD